MLIGIIYKKYEMQTRFEADFIEDDNIRVK